MYWGFVQFVVVQCIRGLFSLSVVVLCIGGLSVVMQYIRDLFSLEFLIPNDQYMLGSM